MRHIESMDNVSDKELASNDSKKNPLVSVGMPVYNGEPYIRDALESLLEQTFTDFELIISDNASTDGTEKICREYLERDNRIRYFRQVENRGATANFRFVLDQAVGEYFMWAASDDLQTPEFIKILAHALDQDPSLVCVMSDVKNIGAVVDGDNAQTVIDDIRIDDVKKNWPKCRKRFFRNPTSNIFFCIYGLFRTEILKSIDLNYRNFHRYAFSSEVALLAQVALHGQIATIARPEKLYRRHNASTYNIEQQVIKNRDRLLGFGSVSLSLLLIAVRSDLPLLERITLVREVVFSFSRWLSSVLLRKLYYSFRRASGFTSIK